MMLIELNPIYRAAWEAVKGAGSYYYGDPDKIEQAGKELCFPCLLRLLRTVDRINSGIQGKVTCDRNETFLFGLKVAEFPDEDEEVLENRIRWMAYEFFKHLRASRKVRFSEPTEQRWYRRDLNQFSLCLAFTAYVTPLHEDLLC